MDVRTLPPAAGDAGRDTPQRFSATTLWQAGCSGISSVTCMVSDGNCWISWAKTGACLQLGHRTHLLRWHPGIEAEVQPRALLQLHDGARIAFTLSLQTPRRARPEHASSIANHELPPKRTVLASGVWLQPT